MVKYISRHYQAYPGNGGLRDLSVLCKSSVLLDSPEATFIRSYPFDYSF